MRFREYFGAKPRLSWLIGELLVVVLGVLTALAIDDFATRRAENALEREYMTRIQADIKADIRYFDEFAKERLQIKLAALERIAPVVRGRQPAPDDIESFLIDVSLGGLLGASSSSPITNTTFVDLQATGNLRLIRDVALRRQISNYYHVQERAHQRSRDRLTDYVPTVHALIPAELRGDINLEALESFDTERAVARILTPEFEDVMNQEINNAYFVKFFDRSIRAKELLVEVEAYANRLDP